MFFISGFFAADAEERKTNVTRRKYGYPEKKYMDGKFKIFSRKYTNHSTSPLITLGDKHIKREIESTVRADPSPVGLPPSVSPVGASY